MSKRDDSLLLEDILEAVSKIKKYVAGLNFEAFVADDKTLDAVIRNFEIIGEASVRLSEQFKIANSSVPWHHLRGLRNRIVHEYFGIDPEIVWTIIKNDLDELITQLKKLR